jgi:hypothetical protein
MDDGDEMDVSQDGSFSKRAVCRSEPFTFSQLLTTYRSATHVEQESQSVVLRRNLTILDLMFTQDPM